MSTPQYEVLPGGIDAEELKTAYLVHEGTIATIASEFDVSWTTARRACDELGLDEDQTAHAQFSDPVKARAAARRSGKTERSEHTCPKCGEKFQNLPAHLRACDGGEFDADL